MNPETQRIVELIGDLDQSLAEMSHAEPLSGLWIMRSSLQEQRDRLATELSESLIRQQAPSLSLTFDGPVVQGESLSAPFIGRALERVQAVLEAIGQAIEGEPTRGGFIQGSVRAATEMRLASFAHGSFGVQLLGRLGPDQQDLFIPGVQGGLLERALERMLTIVEMAEGEEDDQHLLEAVADLGQRSISRLRDWTKTFVNSGTEVHLRWESPNMAARSASLSPGAADSLLEFLSTVDTDVAEVVAVGRLIGARLHRDTFDLEIDEDRILEGRVAPDARGQMETYFGHMCRARLQRTVARGRAGRRSSEKYLLLELQAY